MHNFPAYMDQNIALMREGMKQHVMLPKVIGDKILAQLAEMNWEDPTKHGFYKPFAKMPAVISEADKKRLSEAGQTTIRADVLPTFQRFRDFMKNEYVPVLV